MKIAFLTSIVVLSVTGLGLFGVTLTSVSCAAGSSMASADPSATPVTRGSRSAAKRNIDLTDGEFDGVEIVKPDAEWKRLLTADEYHILREEGTEFAYTGELTDNHAEGTYYCAACGLALFSSATKFESGTGWPSFFKPIYAKNVTEVADNKFAEQRIEIECGRCHSHIGHVFDDGPEPTGLRYCMNSAALRFRAKQ